MSWPRERSRRVFPVGKTPGGQAERLRRKSIVALLEARGDGTQFGDRPPADEAHQMSFWGADRTAWRLGRGLDIMSAAVKTLTGGHKTGPSVSDGPVERNVTASVANEVWLVDTIDHRTIGEKLWLLAIKDLFSRQIFGVFDCWTDEDRDHVGRSQQRRREAGWLYWMCDSLPRRRPVSI